MKTDREFMDGIYLKAQKYEEPESKKRVPIYRRKELRLGLSVAFAVLFLVVGITVHKGLGNNNTSINDGKVKIIRSEPFSLQNKVAIINGEIIRIRNKKTYFSLKIEEIIDIDSDYEKEISNHSKIKVYFDPSDEYIKDQIYKNQKATIIISKNDKGKWFLIDITERIE